MTTNIALAPTARAQSLPVPIVVSTPVPPLKPKIDPIEANCYLYIKSIYPTLPLASKITPNTTPAVGMVAVFQYPGEPHYAIITKLEDKGFWVRDSNFGGPGIRTHFYEWDTPHLVGFYKVGDTMP